MESERPQPEPTVATVVPEHPAPPAKRHRRGPIIVLLVIFLLVCLCGLLLLNVALSIGDLASLGTKKVQEEYFSHEHSSANKVVIITLEGTIIKGSGFIKRQIDQVKKDEDVKAIVLRINSPGGTITGSDYIYHHLKELTEEREIPIVVSMGSLAASGGYYVAMACGNENEDVIFAEPTTWTGSIGVRISLFDLSKLLTKWGVKDNTIASHDLKTMGSFAKEMTPKEKEIWQALIDEAFDRFKTVIKEGRTKFKNDPKALDRLATGQVFSATQAKKKGLIDQIGFIEKAVDRAVELAELPVDDVTVVRYKREPSLADFLISAQAKKQVFDPETLLDMSTPRAYFLFTRSPALMTSP